MRRTRSCSLVHVAELEVAVAQLGVPAALLRDVVRGDGREQREPQEVRPHAPVAGRDVRERQLVEGRRTPSSSSIVPVAPRGSARRTTTPTCSRAAARGTRTGRCRKDLRRDERGWARATRLDARAKARRWRRASRASRALARARARARRRPPPPPHRARASARLEGHRDEAQVHERVEARALEDRLLVEGEQLAHPLERPAARSPPARAAARVPAARVAAVAVEVHDRGHALGLVRRLGAEEGAAVPEDLKDGDADDAHDRVATVTLAIAPKPRSGRCEKAVGSSSHDGIKKSSRGRPPAASRRLVVTTHPACSSTPSPDFVGAQAPVTFH